MQLKGRAAIYALASPQLTSTFSFHKATASQSKAKEITLYVIDIQNPTKYEISIAIICKLHHYHTEETIP